MQQKIFERLSKSNFRSKFKLSASDLDYVNKKGFDIIELHARDFIAERIAPDNIPNDGKQTPYKNHPVFIAQHATATCCRSCIMKWHNFPKGIKLSENQQKYIVDVIMSWIKEQYNNQKVNTHG